MAWLRQAKRGSFLSWDQDDEPVWCPIKQQRCLWDGLSSASIPSDGVVKSRNLQLDHTEASDQDVDAISQTKDGILLFEWIASYSFLLLSTWCLISIWWLLFASHQIPGNRLLTWRTMWATWMWLSKTCRYSESTCHSIRFGADLEHLNVTNWPA